MKVKIRARLSASQTNLRKEMPPYALYLTSGRSLHAAAFTLSFALFFVGLYPGASHSFAGSSHLTKLIYIHSPKPRCVTSNLFHFTPVHPICSCFAAPARRRCSGGALTHTRQHTRFSPTQTPAAQREQQQLLRPTKQRVNNSWL